jgi:hypothetical protein
MALWGLLDNEDSKPKYLNTADKAECYGADNAEVTASAGVNSEGWVLRKVVGSRTQFETLVAMSSGSMGADVADFDHDDDSGTAAIDDDTVLSDS